MINGFLDNLTRDLHLPRAPFWMVAGAITFVTLTWVPLALIARARVTLSEKPRVHLFLDMDEQPKYGAQDYSLLFEDHRAMRPPVPGTVARGELALDDHFERGFRVVAGEGGQPAAEYFPGMPAQVRVDQALLLRGQTQYNTYCFPCHGAAGYGDGPVHVRSARLADAQAAGTVWLQPSNLHAIDTGTGGQVYGPQTYPDGKLFNVITHGIRNMGGYGDQIEPHDRWAIVAYVRALQTSQFNPGQPTQAAAE